MLVLIEKKKHKVQSQNYFHCDSKIHHAQGSKPVSSTIRTRFAEKNAWRVGEKDMKCV